MPRATQSPRPLTLAPACNPPTYSLMTYSTSYTTTFYSPAGAGVTASATLIWGVAALMPSTCAHASLVCFERHTFCVYLRVWGSSWSKFTWLHSLVCEHR